MVVIAGTLRDSADRVIPKARLSVKLTEAIYDVADDPDSTLLPLESQFIITNGVLSAAQYVNADGTLATAGVIDLLPSYQFGAQYYFKLESIADVIKSYTQDGVEYSGPSWQWTAGGTPNNQWYTGQAPGATATTGPPTSDQKILTRITAPAYTRIDDFYATIAASPATQEYSLLRKSGLSSTLDDSAYLVLEALTTNPIYLDRISGKFNVRGVYDSTVFYAKQDVVVSGSILAVYINASSTAGNAPPTTSGGADTAYWAKLPNLTVSPTNQSLSAYLLKAGGVMTGDLLLPAWGATPDPATAVRIADGDARYARLTTDQTIGGIKTFSASPLLPDLTVGTSGSQAINSKLLVESNRDTVIGLGVSGVGGTTPANRVVPTSPTASPAPAIFWAAESDTLNLFDPTTGIFTSISTGAASWRVSCVLELQASAAFTGFAKLWLYALGTVAAPVANGFRLDDRYAVMATGDTLILRGEYRITLSASERLSIRVSASAANLVVNTNNNNLLSIRRAF